MDNNVKNSLTSEERETLIGWSDEDDKIFIYSTQKRIITKLLRNPQFILSEKFRNKNYHQDPLGVKGFLPLNGITIRTTSKKGIIPKNFDPKRFSKCYKNRDVDKE